MTTEELLATINAPLPASKEAEEGLISCLFFNPNWCDEAPPAEQVQGVRSPIGEIREEDIPGALKNPTSVEEKIESESALKKMSKSTKDKKEIAQVATIASNNDKTIGSLIAEAMEKVGKDGVIQIEEAKSSETKVRVTEGMMFDRGYVSPYFVTNPDSMEGVLENALILIYDKKISAMKDILHILEKVAQQGAPLLIISEDLEAVEIFMQKVDSAIVMHNASTQFADGGEFGFGAEIGIATGRMHARGPVGVEQLTSFNYRVYGQGQVRD